MRNPSRLSIAIESARRQTRFPDTVHWVPFSLAQGDAGLAVMCAYLDECFPGEDWDRAGHTFLAAAGRVAERARFLPVGVFSGLGGLAFAAWSLSRGGARYRRLLQSLNHSLLPRALALAGRAGLRSGLAVSEFDVVSGFAGLCGSLLPRAREPEVRTVIEAILAALARICAWDDGLPRWYTPRGLLGSEALEHAFPEGSLNCGLAHGIPGPIAAMSLALREGITVPGQREALTGACEWLGANRADDSCGINWPTAIPLAPASDPPPHAPSRAAWCYGSPGIARALWLAGEALDRSDFRELAVAAMDAVYRRPLPERRIDSPTFCHGIAGLLQITLRFACDTGLSTFREAADALLDQLLAAYDPERVLGFASLESGCNQVDQAGLLDGAPGVALVLLATGSDIEPRWDRMFLLA